MSFNRTHKIILFYFLFCLVSYFLMRFIADLIDKYFNQEGSFWERLFNGIYIIWIGFLVFFLSVNMVSIAGFFISRKRKDAGATTAFKITTWIIVTATVLFYLGNYLS
jgi:hypothetical protein